MNSASKLGVAASVGLIVSFFLPWFPAVPVSISAYNLSQLGSYGNWAWLIPTVGTVCIVGNMTRRLLPSARHLLALMGAVIVFGVMFFILSKTLHQTGAAIGLGVYVLSISAVALFVSGCIEPLEGTDRSVLAIMLSYAVMVIFFMAVFMGAYLALGVERVFQPDSYEVSTLWMGLAAFLSFCGSILGGFICAAISKSKRTCQVFAFLVFFVGLLACIPAMKRNPDAPNVRAGEVPNLQAMQLAVTPLWMHLLTPVISAAGVLLGARMKLRFVRLAATYPGAP